MNEKRFWCLEGYEGETSPIVDGKFAPTNEWLCNMLNKLYDENQVLRETLKNQYMNEICETCVYGEYWCNSYGEGEFECHKGYDGSECDGKTECDDFELNIKGMNIRMVEE